MCNTVHESARCYPFPLFRKPFAFSNLRTTSLCCNTASMLLSKDVNSCLLYYLCYRHLFQPNSIYVYAERERGNRSFSGKLVGSRVFFVFGLNLVVTQHHKFNNCIFSSSFCSLSSSSIFISHIICLANLVLILLLFWEQQSWTQFIPFHSSLAMNLILVTWARKSLYHCCRITGSRHWSLLR